MARGNSGNSKKKLNNSGSRSDRRYKDQGAAPSIVSEKRLTFFLPDATFRILRLQTGYFQVHNAQSNSDEDGLPETPSALLREAIDLWLDQFRPAGEQTRTEAEWEERVNAMRKVLKRLG